ncbi:MAG: 1,2-phenylacetyl-CoA epoxidase subunit PaaD [Gammaproteobacteria bacterium]
MVSRLAAIRRLAAAVPDPEIPVLTLHDLGILRDVVLEHGTPTVLLTPTYSGCPATEAIASQVRAALDEAGFDDARVRTVLSPAWTTDWMSEEGRRKLREYGIAPPACMSCKSGRIAATPRCPRCDSAEVESISRWASTPCKALYRCTACLEPFDYFKPH